MENAGIYILLRIQRKNFSRSRLSPQPSRDSSSMQRMARLVHRVL